MHIPYTYLISWTKLNRHYYGCRYAKNCNPTDLWNPYYTSSKYVSWMREFYGEPDIIQVRKIFDSVASCREWEEKVLIKMNVVRNDRWLNKTNNRSIDPMLCDTKPMLGKTHTLATIEKMKKSKANISKSTRYKMRLAKLNTQGENNNFYGKTHSVKTRSIWSQKRSGTQLGHKNHNAKKLEYNGSTFGTMQELAHHLSTSMYYIRKMINDDKVRCINVS